MPLFLEPTKRIPSASQWLSFEQFGTKLFALKWLVLLGFFCNVLVQAGVSIPLQTVSKSEDNQTRYWLDTWGVDDGLPQNWVIDIEQDQNGYLWMGTLSGIVRFDGQIFDTFRTATHPLFEDDTINAVHVGRDGTLYIGTGKELIEWNPNDFHRYKAPGDLPFGKVMDIVPSSKGGVWVLSHSDGHGLSHVQKGQMNTIQSAWLADNGARSFSEDQSGNLWIVSSGSAAMLDVITQILKPLVLPFELNSCEDILIDSTNRIWIASKGGVHLRIENTWHWISLRGSFSENQILRISEDREGLIWISTQQGVASLNHNLEWTYYQLPNNQETNYFYEVIQDQEGHHWFGSRTTGLHRIRHPHVRVLNQKDGLLHDSIWSVCPGKDDSLWIGTGGGLSHWHNETAKNWDRSKGMLRRWVTSVCETQNGSLWIGTRTSSGEPGNASCVFRMIQGNIEQISSNPLNDISRVWAIFESSDRTVWIATRNGLFACPQGNPEALHEIPEFQNLDVRVITEGADGTIYAGGNGFGIKQLNQTGWSDMANVATGLSNNNVWVIHRDLEDQNTLWIGTESGINRLKEGNIDVFLTEQGLFDNLVNQILEDDYGNLWVSCNRGVYRLAKSDLNKVAKGDWEMAPHVAYGLVDGMLDPETNGECQPAGCRTKSGQIVFPTGKGLAVFDPKSLLNVSHPPMVVIEDIHSNGHQYFSNSLDSVSFQQDSNNIKTEPTTLRLPAGSGDLIEIGFTATSFLGPNKTRFQYRLLGHHTDWIEAGTRRSAYYVNLGPGDYRFEVRAANHQGVWNEQECFFLLKIAPHFHETVWFYACISLVGLAMLFSLHRIILINRVNVANLEEKVHLNEERMRIAQDIHDEMGARLTEISMLGELADPETNTAKDVSDSVKRIKEKSETLIKTVDEIVWSTNPKQDTLEALVAYLGQWANEFLRGSKISAHVSIPSPSEIPQTFMASETRHHLFLTATEALNNCVRHSGATHVHFQCELLPDDVLKISIQDNGTGMPDLTTSYASKGNGLKNMKARMKKIGGSVEWENLAEKGCKVEITFKLDRV